MTRVPFGKITTVQARLEASASTAEMYAWRTAREWTGRRATVTPGIRETVARLAAANR